MALAGPEEARRCSPGAVGAPEGSVEAPGERPIGLGSPCDDAGTERHGRLVAKEEKEVNPGE